MNFSVAPNPNQSGYLDRFPYQDRNLGSLWFCNTKCRNRRQREGLCPALGHSLILIR